MKKRVEKYLVFVLAAVMLACMFTFPVLAADSANQVTTTSRNNVVFVTDSSGSMQTTDPDNNRFEAAKLFVAEIANDGNYLGSVSFGEGITDAQEVKNLSGQNEKNAFVDHIKNSSNYENSTNIGAGLSKAVDLLDNGRNKDLNSSIILLSDGNTDMPDKDKTQASLDMKADAIERARNAGYRIFTICLNADGSADTSELKQIADATNGAFTEVKDAADLKDVETMYNEKIFGSIEDSDGGSITIGPDGTVSKTFKVPGIGVEELNVLIEGTVTKCELTDPQNKIYSGNEIESSTVRGTDFLIEKIISPAGGTWTAKAYGNPNAVINFRPLYNLNFSIVTAISPESDYKVGQTVHFTASIADNTGTITDTSRYTDFNGEVHVKSAADEQTYPMTLGASGFEYDYTIPADGTYYADLSVHNDNMTANSAETYEISVNNSSPVPPKKEPKAHANIWPIIGGKATVNLDGTATDPEGQQLTYSIDSSAFNKDDYILSGTKLTVKHFSIPKGSFEVRATDPEGAYCTFNVLYTSTNIGLIMAIAAGLGIIIAALVAFLGIKKLLKTPFMGTIAVQKITEGGAGYLDPIKLTPKRGRCRLEAFGLGKCGLPDGSYFQAGGKTKCVFFVSKTPVFSNMAMGPTKKVRIQSLGGDVLIYSNDTKKTGIVVSFTSLLDQGRTF